MDAAGDQTRDMGHIYHQVSADLVGDLTETLEVNDTRISGRAADDHLRLAFLRGLKHLIIVDPMGLGVYAVADDVEVLAADIHRRAVSQVTALAEVHAHDGVAGLEHREIDDLVRLRAGMGLNVRVLGAEQLAGALAGDILSDIHREAAAVVALGRIALGVLVGQHGAHRRHHRGRNDVLAGDQLEVLLLTLQLLRHRVADLGVILRYKTD